MKDLETAWRPFEPCLENVRATRTLVEVRDGAIFYSHNYSGAEMRVMAESAAWMKDIKNPTMQPVKEKK